MIIGGDSKPVQYNPCAPLCAHCLSPQQGYASVGDAPLCHPDEGMDCYFLVTVYRHGMPCDRDCNG